MTNDTKLMCGVIVLTIPTIEFGGHFLLSLLRGQNSELGLTGFQKAMFRAGHAHAGVLVILSLLGQLLVDAALLSPSLVWAVRVGMPVAAICVSGGFFFSAMGKGSTQANSWIRLLYAGVFALVLSLVILGVGLIRSSQAPAAKPSGFFQNLGL